MLPPSVVEVTGEVAGLPAHSLVGAGIEDVNHELAGLCSQMISGESFEEPPYRGLSGAAFVEDVPADPAGTHGARLAAESCCGSISSLS